MPLNLHRFGRSQRFDSIEILTDNDGCEEIMNLEKEILAMEKAQKKKNHLLSHNSLRKVSTSIIDKRKKIKDKTNDGISSKMAYNGNTNSTKIKSLLYKHSIKRNLRANAMKQIEIQQPSQIINFCNSNENQCTFQNLSIQDIPSTSNSNKIEGERILWIQTLSNGCASNSSIFSKFLKTQNIGLWEKGTNLKFESKDSSDTKLSTTLFAKSGSLKMSNENEVKKVIFIKSS
jgi:hypothetical protein